MLNFIYNTPCTKSSTLVYLNHTTLQRQKLTRKVLMYCDLGQSAASIWYQSKDFASKLSVQ